VTRIFSPFLLFYKFFEIPTGYSLARITELFLAAVFMYIFLVGVGAGPAGALAGTLVLSFSAHSMLHLSGLGWWGGMMWLPLILLSVDRAATRESYRWAILAGVLLAAQFYCGWMQNQIYFVGAIVLYYLFFGFKKIRSEKTGTSRSTGWKSITLAATTIGAGLGLAATQWLPVMEMLGYSNRRIVPTEIGYIYLPPWYLSTMVFPNLFGSADDVRTLTLFTALNVSHDHILYIGIAALAPLAYCIYRLKRRGPAGDENAIQDRAAFFLILAIVSLIIMTAAPIYVHMTRFIPVLQVIRVTVRAGVLFIFAVSVLVGFGLKQLLEPEKGALERFAYLAKRFVILTAILVATAIASSYLITLTGIAYNDTGQGKAAWLRRAASVLSEQFTPPQFDIVFPFMLLVILLLLLKGYARGSLTRTAFLTGLMLMLGVDLYWVTTQFNPTFDSARVFPATLITERIKSLPPGRVLVAPSDLDTNRRVATGAEESKIIAPPNTLLPYRIPAIAGKNQQFPRWYRDYASLIEPQPYLSHVVFDETDSRFFDLLNVRYILTGESNPSPGGGELILKAEGASLYEMKSALPRAFLVGDVIEVRDQSEALDSLKGPGFNPRSAVVVETGREARQRVGEGNGSAIIIEDKRNRVVIDCETQDEAMLVLSDNYYPGWKAYVDGNEAEVSKANCTMRAVRVQPGRHMVSFEFAPATLRNSVYVTAFTAALIIAALAVIGVRQRPRGPVRGN
jgi:hypothetical protein